MDVEEDVGTPRARAGPEPEELPASEVKEDADGRVTPARTRRSS